MEWAGFDWDEGNLDKCLRHGVPREEIERLFLFGPVKVAPDLDHSDREDRLIAIGRTSDGRPIFVAFTLRNRSGLTLVRPVSARYMHRKEVRRHEAGSEAEDR